MKLGELKVGDKFRIDGCNVQREKVCERQCQSGFEDGIEVVVWSELYGFSIKSPSIAVHPTPKHEYKVGDWVQCDSVDGVFAQYREFMRVGDKYEMVSISNKPGSDAAQVRNAKGHSDGVYYLLDRFSPTEEPKPQYRPYPDLRVLVGKVLSCDNDERQLLCTEAVEQKAWIGHDCRGGWCAEEVLSQCTHLDGTPCGELVEE